MAPTPSSPDPAPSGNGELADEQAYVCDLYARLDELRERTERQLVAVRRSRASGSPQNRSERDAFATLHENRLAQLRAVEDRLCFGRLDITTGERRYVGRIGLSDESQATLLVDWRAPAARAFYQATAASPGDVVRRRHLATARRTVTGYEDEVLDLDALDEDERTSLTGEAALLAAVGSSRTGRMHDIVATIQAEQDAIIRSELAGVLVVQGGPGTGKTAVALHRAAYLLYTHRERLGRSGVLVVGPSPVFLRYIEQVLPSLGETGVVLSTPGELFPGVATTLVEPDDVVRLKGDVRMAGVIARAVRARQGVIDAPVRLDVEGTTVTLRPAAMEAARARARATHKPHNEARVTFVREMLDHLAAQLARALRMTMTSEDHTDLVHDLRASKDVRRVLNLAWPPLTPQSLISRLLSDPDGLAGASASSLSAAEQRLLLRDRDAPWTVADVPLLDEAAELLGEDDAVARQAALDAVRAGEEALSHAREVLESGAAGAAAGMLSAAALAERFADEGPVLSVAERAGHDRTWAYGHLVVDEAQELSAMTWRLLFRRCPSRSMTVVGDIAQTGGAAGVESWKTSLDPYVEGRWRLARLSVNYRTPARVMAVAEELLEAAGLRAQPQRAVREGAWDPTAHPCAPEDLPETVAHVVGQELGLLGQGRLAVVAPRSLLARVSSELLAALPAGTVGSGVDTPVSVLPVAEVKGLEFDAVVLVEPAAVVGESPRGVNDLYVALTRPTQRLRVVHAQRLPAALEAGLTVVPRY